MFIPSKLSIHAKTKQKNLTTVNETLRLGHLLHRYTFCRFPSGGMVGVGGGGGSPSICFMEGNIHSVYTVRKRISMKTKKGVRKVFLFVLSVLVEYCQLIVCVYFEPRLWVNNDLSPVLRYPPSLLLPAPLPGCTFSTTTLYNTHGNVFINMIHHSNFFNIKKNFMCEVNFIVLHNHRNLSFTKTFKY